MFNIFLSAISALISVTTRLFFIALPSILVMMTLSSPMIQASRGAPTVGIYQHAAIHELFPNSSWNDLVPCGQYFDEKEEFRKARACVNEKVWADRPLTTEEKDFPIPRCYIIKAQSPNILGREGINFLPIFDYSGIGAVVGVYQPETRTVFVVENVDAPMVYRHELQHYFLHEHDPETEGGGHDQEIWNKCEPPYYTPSERAVQLGKQPNETEKSAETPAPTETPESATTPES